MTKTFEPGEGNRFDRPEEKAPEPPGGFVDSTVYVYRLKNNGSRGKLLRTEDPFPGGAVTPNVWRKRKKGARGMPTKYDWDKILPIAFSMREKGVVYSEIAESLNIPHPTLYKKMRNTKKTEGKSMRIDWAEIYPQVEKEKGEEKKVSTGSIDWEKLYPKFEKMLQEGKDKTEITEILDIPFPQLADKIALEEQKKYQKNKEQGQPMTIAGKQKDMKAADPTPQESVPKKAEKEKSFKCAQCGTSLDGIETICWPRDGREAPLCLDCFRGGKKHAPRNERGHIIWERVWPDISKKLENGMKPREVAHMYGIDPEPLRKKIERERANSGQRHNDIIAGLKEKWIQDVLDDMNLDTKTKLQMIKDLTGMWGVA